MLEVSDGAREHCLLPSYHHHPFPSSIATQPTISMGATLSVVSYESFTLVAVSFIFAKAAVTLGTQALDTFARWDERGSTRRETAALDRLESGRNSSRND